MVISMLLQLTSNKNAVLNARNGSDYGEAASDLDIDYYYFGTWIWSGVEKEIHNSLQYMYILERLPCVYFRCFCMHVYECRLCPLCM